MATLRLDITDEQMAAFNRAATEAGYTVYEWALLKMGFASEAAQARSKREALAPRLEDKDAAPLERQRGRREGHKAAE